MQFEVVRGGIRMFDGDAFEGQTEDHETRQMTHLCASLIAVDGAVLPRRRAPTHQDRRRASSLPLRHHRTRRPPSWVGATHSWLRELNGARSMRWWPLNDYGVVSTFTRCCLDVVLSLNIKHIQREDSCCSDSGTAQPQPRVVNRPGDRTKASSMNGWRVAMASLEHRTRMPDATRCGQCKGKR